nr:TlpA disulfide reductase family protein [Kineosporia rhizophila]
MEAGAVAEIPVAERGEPIELSGTALTGEAIDLSERRGSVVVLNVWASWCPPCRVEAPILARAASDFTKDGVVFLGINVRDNPASAKAFEERQNIGYPSLDDSGGQAIMRLSQYVPASAIPVTLILDQQGRVAARVLGPVTEATLRSLIESAIAA